MAPSSSHPHPAASHEPAPHPAAPHAPAPHAADPHGTGHHRHGHAAPDGAGPRDGLARLLDLDAELFAPYRAGVLDRLAHLAGDGVSRITDLGAGTGTGTFALLERFPGARVTAVDTSPDMLALLTAAARERGLDGRLATLEADVTEGLPGPAGAELVWASAALHHFGDPAASLAGIRAALRPGGLLAVAEMDGMPRFLPEDVVPDRPGLEGRLRAALDALHAERVPHLGDDWGAHLTAAGFTVELEHAEDLELRAPLPEGAGLYAYLVLARVREALDGRVAGEDLAALDALVGGGPDDVRHRDDLVVRSRRELWVARRPGDTA
ncbi:MULTISPECIES: class I SAM-dependent methyltransferase [unclassified Streptomyces]|uniref:class I SAM-dependent methyltransferase n=1 Tax=unclassified Streptomyces TaxID=2593676 RepID=UPI0004B76D49|nr:MULTISPECIES: class I SAM-dependent methyltransferase [unclassified Streptomyces]MYY16593.1 methyltransferase domain-containing protein [Streptomyces sp. SID4912]SCD73177.1 Methyltransferase domain-containing protein [Streptomyces sp. DpondAA-D4]